MNKVVELVDPQMVVNLSKGLCRMPSPAGQEKPIAEFLSKELARLGFEVELQEVVADRPNVVAILRGDPEYQSFMFNGHLDAAGPFGEWKQDPFEPWIEDDVLYAADLQDMKGGVAAMVAGADAVARAGLQKHGDIIITATMHHDTSGVGTKYFLESNAWRIDAGICAEPSDLKVQLFHSGAWAWEIKVQGSSPCHSSRLEEVVNPINGMVEILSQLDINALTFEADPDIAYLPRLVIGSISGGEYNSVTAEECIARGDVRFLPSMTVDGMKADLRRLVEQVCSTTPGLSGSVRTVVQQWPYQISADEAVVQSLIQAHSGVTGKAPELSTGLPCGAYITDGADMVRHGIPTVFYGPGDWHAMPNEGVPIADLVVAAQVYAATCADIVTRKR